MLSALLLLPAALAAAGLFALLAWLISRTTVYTITPRRLVLPVGLALPLSINIPFSVIEAADVKLFADGTGDLSVTPARGERVGYLLAWPHVRPWRFARPEPTLRSIPNAAAVAEMLAGALSQSMAPGAASTRMVATTNPAVGSPTAAHPPLVTAA
ncbi:MAG: PH domain-containing protein [Rhodospirillales bacterium]|nr:PH domain-containing protein [Rhodospirillales bacterium]